MDQLPPGAKLRHEINSRIVKFACGTVRSHSDQSACSVSCGQRATLQNGSAGAFTKAHSISLL